MTDALTIQPIAPFDATLRVPGSKSLTNRALLLAALADGPSRVIRPLLADDTHRMLEALPLLGIAVEHDTAGEVVTVHGKAGGIPATSASLMLGNAGTAMRPLTATVCLGHGTYTLDGVARMRQRPIGELVEPLRQLGADIRYLGNEGYPPLEVRGKGLVGGTIKMLPTQSSQFITALAIIAPYCRDGLTIQFDGPVTSQPYVAMTLGLMHRFGVTAAVGDNFTSIAIKPGKYRAMDYDVEPDASNATYFLAAAAAIPGSKCTIRGLGKGSLQGDVGFADVLAQMGAGLVFGSDFITIMSPPKGKKLRGIEVDLNHMPDAAMTLATLALLADGDTVIRNVDNWRVKETDRMEAMRVELTKLGAEVEVDGPDIFITPPADGKITPAAIDTYDDHRMAMSFAVVGLAKPGVTINEPRCVEKTFPDFFDYLKRLGDAVTV